MLARKHYIAIAKIIKGEHLQQALNVNPQRTHDALKAVTSDLADYFESDNPQFDRGKFEYACHGKE